MPYANHLMPPGGTTCFKYQEITSMNGTIEYSDAKTNGIWKACIYVYPTGASILDEEGWENAGRLQAVIVLTGNIDVQSGPIIKHTFSTHCDGAALQLPETGTGVAQGDDHKYTIGFSDTMSVFEGHTAKPFTAEFSNDVIHTKSTQQASVNQLANPYAEFVIDATEGELSHNEIFGLSLFNFPIGYYGDLDFHFFYTWTWADGHQYHLNWPIERVQMPPRPQTLSSV